MRTYRLRLLDAVEQIELILRFSQRGREAFLSDLLMQSAIQHRLALLGEYSAAFSAPGLPRRILEIAEAAD
jgi:uncharacterized protein with HEPN domain